MRRLLPALLLLTLLPTPALAGDQLTISVTPGDHWVHSRTWKGVPLKTRPQMAFWIADLDGNLVQTLYVTRRVGRQSWLGGAFTGEKRDEMRRASALPEDDPRWSGGEYGSGQPSLILRAEIRVGGEFHHEHLVVLGHGHPSGADGLVAADVSTLTTALDIVDAVVATYTPAGT